jgi:tetratricopeptide (TPR) repeat protein
MDEQLLNACRMRDEGKFSAALEEFLRIAETTEDRINKAGVLVYASTTLKLLERYDDARRQLGAARTVAEEYLSPNSSVDERTIYLEVYLDFELADIYRFEGKKEEALAGFDAMIKKHAQRLSEPRFREIRESIEACRAFILADLGRWREAMPILEKARSFTEYKEGNAFYLGHCYLSALDYNRAEEKLSEALRLGLPKNLEYRAHCELGMTYYQLHEYAQAKHELEKCVEMADTSYLRDGIIWKYLEAACRSLGLKDEARHYANLSRPS